MSNYTPQDWYWIVGEDQDLVYSSARAAFVPVEDAEYQAWIEAGGLPTHIISQEELRDVLRTQYPAGWKKSADEVWELIKAKRDELSIGGCKVGEHWFHNDIKSRGQWERMGAKAEKLIAAGSAPTDPYMIDGAQQLWKKMGGTGFVPLTLGFITEVLDAFEVQESRIFKKAEQHNVLMRASQDPASYDFQGGWPEVFADTLPEG